MNFEVNSESVLTLHPDGKQGIRINKDEYELLSAFILFTIKDVGYVNLNRLIDKAQNSFSDPLDAEVAWRVFQIKLDLEARGLITMYSLPYNNRSSYMKLTRHGLKAIQKTKIFSTGAKNE